MIQLPRDGVLGPHSENRCQLNRSLQHQLIG
jgi:hypothetical protein